jgi:predicted glutamine amidotransferase
MCGLIGVAGDLSAREVDIFTNMLRADTFRGAHSTGVAAVRVNLDWRIAKNTVPGWDFPETVRDWSTLVNAHVQVLMGHNRHATRGTVTKMNAHPFNHEQILGMHNGTLTDYDFCPEHKSFGTDSEAMIASFAAKGAKETLSNIRGAWAVVWVDLKKRTLNFTRNDQRPLWIMTKKDSKALLWASEPGLLEWMVDREGIGKQYHGALEVNELGILSYSIPETLTGVWPKPKWTPYEEKPNPFVGRATGEHWKNPNYPATGTSTGTNGQATAALPPPAASNSRQSPPPGFFITDTPAFFVGWDQPAKNFQHILPDGKVLKNEKELSYHFRNKPKCACCGADVKPDERWRAIKGTDAFVCQTCAEDETAFGGYVKRNAA